jgi:ribosomal protein L6P/L9E
MASLLDPRFISIINRALELKDKVRVTGIDKDVVGVTAIIYIYTESEEQAKKIASLIDEVIRMFFRGGR